MISREEEAATSFRKSLVGEVLLEIENLDIARALPCRHFGSQCQFNHLALGCGGGDLPCVHHKRVGLIQFISLKQPFLMLLIKKVVGVATTSDKLGLHLFWEQVGFLWGGRGCLLERFRILRIGLRRFLRPRFSLCRALNQIDKFLIRVQTGQSDGRGERLAVSSNLDWDSPSLREDAKHILEAVGSIDAATAETYQFVVVTEASSKGVRRLEHLANNDPVIIGGSHGRAEGGMINKSSAFQVPHEMLDLVTGNGIAHADIDSPSFFQRDTSIDSDHLTAVVEKWASGVARIDGGVRLNAVGILQ